MFEFERDHMQGGKTLLISNPVAKNGEGAAAHARAFEQLRAALGNDQVDGMETTHAGHAVERAAEAGAYGTVIALGGDGIIHEVANGLMRIPAPDRPHFGILPVGSGNDYARTLGMSVDLDVAVRQVLEAPVHAVDVGRCNGEFFVETLSFGLDAAIALDTVERRKHSRKTGAALYMESGIDQLLHHRDLYRFEVVFGNGDVVRGSAYLFAVQIGPTYGGGFLICPDAQPDDGLFDVCLAHPPLGLAKATFVFLLAKNGRHTKFKQVELLRASSLRLTFDQRPPVQIDGESLVADVFDIDIVPRAFEVLMPARRERTR